VTINLQTEPTVEVTVGGVNIGPSAPVCVIAGPCSVESHEQFLETALAVTRAGVKLLRGGAFKPRTSPYSFQGLGMEGLRIMRAVANELQVGLVTEALAVEDVKAVAEHADMIQIGARNMDNRALLSAAADSGLPVMLKRGLTASVEETLIAAEHLSSIAGDNKVLICERGSPTFEPALRNSLDIAAIAELKFRSRLPVVADPSHGTGRSDLVLPVSLAGIAAGADAVIVEVHPRPEVALSDGYQSLETSAFGDFMDGVRRMASAVGRSV
jgi:3-deoxy-7-phosphoheptulonate synthase